MNLVSVLVGTLIILYGAFSFFRWWTDSLTIMRYILFSKPRLALLQDHKLRGSWHERVGAAFFFVLEILLPLLVGALAIKRGINGVALF